MANGVGHGEYGESEGEGNANEANAKLWECGGENSGAAASKDEPEGTKELSSYYPP
jgi:hypothetical protein